MEPIHPYRWRFLAIWIVVFTVATGWGLRTNRDAIHKLKENKAALSALQSTNCGLKKFLLTARAARSRAYKEQTDPVLKRTDLQAVHAYDALLAPFTREATGHCVIPARLRRATHG